MNKTLTVTMNETGMQIQHTGMSTTDFLGVAEYIRIAARLHAIDTLRPKKDTDNKEDTVSTDT